MLNGRALMSYFSKHGRVGWWPAAAAVLLCALSAGVCQADRIKVYVMAGQSNMSGSAELPWIPSELVGPHEDIQYSYKVNLGSDQSNGWGPLRLRNGIKFGSEMSFGRSMADAMPDENIAVLKVTKDASLLRLDWRPPRPLFHIFIDRVNSQLDLLVDEGWEPEVAGMVWVQGSGDSRRVDVANKYGRWLPTFIEAVRTDINFTIEDMPFVLNRLHINADRPDEPKKLVREAQLQAARADRRVKIVSIDDLRLKKDNVHFKAPTHVELGYRASYAIRHLMTLPTPEPSTLAMLTVLAAGALRRRRRAA